MIGYPQLGSMGRLGNQLWQIAGTLSIAVKRNDGVSLPTWKYAPYFSVPARVFNNLSCVDAADCAPHLGLAAPYLQDKALIGPVEPIIRDWFAPSDLSRSLVRGEYDLPEHAVAVHVRRTDYVSLPEYYVNLSTFWYSQAMQLVRERDPEAKFFVFSDDPDWCREHLPEAFVMSKDNEILDFWLMASCKHHIIANSCFSWWAAWISGDPAVVIPRDWYGPAYTHIDPARFYWPGWEVL